MDTHQLEGRPVLYRLLHRQECETIGGLGQGHYLLSQDKLTCTGQALPTERFTLYTCYQEEGPPTVWERTNWLSRVSACTGMQNISMEGERVGVLREGREGTTTIQ